MSLDLDNLYIKQKIIAEARSRNGYLSPTGRAFLNRKGYKVEDLHQISAKHFVCSDEIMDKIRPY